MAGKVYITVQLSGDMELELELTTWHWFMSVLLVDWVPVLVIRLVFGDHEYLALGSLFCGGSC